jgi:hypothetical protein
MASKKNNSNLDPNDRANKGTKNQKNSIRGQAQDRDANLEDINADAGTTSGAAIDSDMNLGNNKDVQDTGNQVDTNNKGNMQSDDR